MDIYLDASRLGIYTIKNKIKRTINKKIGNLSIHIYVNSDLSSVSFFNGRFINFIKDYYRHVRNLTPLLNRPFASNDHVVQNPPCWRAKVIIIPALEHQNKGKSSFTGSGLFILMSQCRNNNELALQHGGFCIT